jgi:hypothetical protein
LPVMEPGWQEVDFVDGGQVHRTRSGRLCVVLLGRNPSGRHSGRRCDGFRRQSAEG